MIGIDFGLENSIMTSTYVVMDADGNYIEMGELKTYISEKHPSWDAQFRKNEICEMLSNRFGMKVIQETP